MHCVANSSTYRDLPGASNWSDLHFRPGRLNPIKRGSLVRRCSLQGPGNDTLRRVWCGVGVQAQRWAGTDLCVVLPW